MEYHRKKRTLKNIMDEEKQFSIIRSSHNNHNYEEDDDVQLSPSRPSNTSPIISFIPSSPGGPDSPYWTLSPIQVSSPSPSILYQCIVSLHREEGYIHSIAISKGLIFTSSETRKIRAWRQQDCVQRGNINASCGEIRSILAYGNMIFSTHKDHKIRMWNFGVLGGSVIRSRKVATLPIRNPFQCLNPTSSSNPNNHHHHLHHHKSEKHKDLVTCMAHYHAEGILYTGSWDKTVKAWMVSDNRCIDSFYAHENHINAIIVNQEDGCVFTGSSDGCVRIWRRLYNESSHILTMTLKSQPYSPVNALTLNSSIDNRTLLYSGSADGFINIWEKEKMSSRFNHVRPLQGHQFSVLCLVALQNLIFSGSEDTTIRVWRREGDNSCYHECLAVLDGHIGPVRCLAACLEVDKIVKGFLVYSASLDQSFKVWKVRVMPEEKQNRRTMIDCEMSPVLSPSWVKKKLQGGHRYGDYPVCW